MHVQLMADVKKRKEEHSLTEAHAKMFAFLLNKRICQVITTKKLGEYQREILVDNISILKKIFDFVQSALVGRTSFTLIYILEECGDFTLRVSDYEELGGRVTHR